MANKSKTYIVHHNGGCRCIGRYRIGAKNEKEAEQLLRGVVGKHAKVRVYYEEMKLTVPRGIVIREC